MRLKLLPFFAFLFILFPILLTSKFDYQKIEISFIENRGQFVDQFGKVNNDVHYIAEVNGGLIYVKSEGISFVQIKAEGLKSEKNLSKGNISSLGKSETPLYNLNLEATKFEFYRLDMEFNNSSKKPKIEGIELLPDYNNYYLAHCPDGITHVRKFRKVSYENVYEKVDFVLYVNENGKVQYDFIVKPGGNPQEINFAFQGAESIQIRDDGSLIVKTPFGDIEQGKPYTYQDNPIQSEFILNKDNSISFKVAEYDPVKPLIIDPPTRIWGTYYHGNNYESAYSVAVDSYDNVYMAGEAFASSMIATAGSHQSSLGGYRDGFLVKFNGDGERQWATYYGGPDYDHFNSIVIDGSDNIYGAGQTSSSSAIATAGSHQSTYGGSTDCFIVKFNTSGVRQWGTYYGGSNWDYNGVVDVDPDGYIYLAGTTSSTNAIATAGSHQSSFAGGYSDGFLAKFNGSGVRQWGTYYGVSGSNTWSVPGHDSFHGIHIDQSGSIYVGGYTYSTSGMVTPGAHQTSLAGEMDVVLAKFNSTGVLQWATYYGGTGGEFLGYISSDAAGYVYISGGTTSSNNISTAGSHQYTFGGVQDAFLVKFNSSGTRQWGTYYGGSNGDGASGIYIDPNDNVYIYGGTTSSANIATVDAFKTEISGTWEGDAFLALFNTSGTRQWGTYYGGSQEDQFNDMHSDSYGDFYLCGSTTSSSYDEIATEDAHQTALGTGELAAFLVKFGGEEPSNTITITNISKTLFCLGEAFTVNYNATGAFITGNAFTVQLSDASGSFSSPIAIGMLYSITSGTIDCYIPYSVPAGTGYRIRIVSSNPSLTSSNNGTDLVINLTPEVGITGDDFVCQNNAYSYSADNESTTFEWIAENGTIIGSSTSNQVNVTWGSSSFGTLKLIQTNSAGCKDSVTMNIYIMELPLADVFGDEELCLGQEGSYSVYIGGGELFSLFYGEEYKWKVTGGIIVGADNQESVSVLWNTPGTNKVKVIVTSMMGCMDSTEFEVLIHDLPAKPEISSSLDMLMSTCTQFNQWFLDGEPIPGAYDYIYMPTQTGYYQVQCIDENGCESELSDEFFYQIASNSISITSVSGTSFCTGNNLSVTVETSGTFTTGNVFTLQISDRFGSFSNPTVLANVTGPIVNSMNATLPHTLISGNGYRLRVVSSDPSFVGSDNGSNITIGQTPVPQITGNTQVCINSTVQYSANQFEGFYQWQVTGGTIQGSSTNQNVTVKWGNTPPASINLIQTSAFGNCQTTISSPVQFVCFPPNVLTLGVLNLTGTNANLAGEVTNDNGSPVIQRGICWSIFNSNPTINDYVTSEGTGLGEFESMLSNLPPGTTIFFRAYGINEAGVGYGEVLTLTTPNMNMMEINLASKVVCEDQPADLGSPDAITGGSGEYNIRWIPRTGLINEFTMNPTLVRARFSGYYILEVTDYQTGEYAQTVMLLTVKQKPDISLPKTKYSIKRGESVYLGDGLELRNGTAPYTYFWTDRIGFSSEEMNPQVTPQVTTRYFLTVTDADGCFSDEWTIIVQVLRRKDIAGSLIEFSNGAMQIYPNPASFSFVVSADFEKESNFDLRMYDILGRETLKFSKNDASEIEETFNIESLTSGVYLIKLRVDDEEMVYKLIKP